MEAVEAVKAADDPGAQKQDVSCTDGNCPIHGALRLHGRHFTGVIASARMRRTASIVIEKTRFMRKYERYERRLSSIKVHNPECISAKEGDKVEVFECRPLSKTKHFVITKKL
ncbi:30S ribosomal protein S17 [Candidatus Woesearchaeota archaeon]|nr:30S ribosomal protein S17 [Candidatus Woesearchaeota archaeon]